MNETSGQPSDFDNQSEFTRRKFLRLTMAGSLVAGAAPPGSAAEAQSGMPYRTLRRTGEKVSAIGLARYHIGAPTDEQESPRLTRPAIDGRVNSMDTSW